MIKTIYAMKDDLRGFLSPFTDVNDDVAMRNFDFGCKSNDLVNFRPQDFSLYKLGSIDEDSGIITPLASPVYLMSALTKVGE